MSQISWEEGLEQLGCHPTAEQFKKLQQYLGLLQRWNKVYNLTAIRNPDDMLVLHIFDSLVVEPYVQVESCLDVGSGGGLPGIVLAIMQSDHQFTMLDTNGKKTRFIQQAIIELGLKNASVVQARVEKHKFSQQFDVVISRAFASIEDFVNLSSLHLKEGGSLFAMKGVFPEKELQDLPEGFDLKETYKLEVPGLDAQRHLLKIQ